MFDKKSIPVLFLVGGFGTRVKHILNDTPKPLAPVHGRPFLDWVLSLFKALGHSRFYLLTYHQHNQFEQFVAGKMGITCVKEPRPLGTAGAIRNALLERPEISELFVVANGDSISVVDLSSAISSVMQGADAAIIGRKVDDASSYGSMSIDRNGKLQSFDEKIPGGSIINSGIYVFKKDSFLRSSSEGSSSLEYDVLPAMLEMQFDIRVSVTDGAFIDIGTEASIKEMPHFIKMLCSQGTLNG